MKFKGKYINGKKIYGKGYNLKKNLILKIEKNGKGKEFYNNGKFLFEGEYLNGRRWKGIGYNHIGIPDFGIINGKGKGKKYDFDDNLQFEGEYLNGIRHGLELNIILMV